MIGALEVTAMCMGLCGIVLGPTLGLHARRAVSLARGVRGLVRAGVWPVVGPITQALGSADGLHALWLACHGLTGPSDDSHGHPSSPSSSSSSSSPSASASASASPSSPSSSSSPGLNPPTLLTLAKPTDGGHLFSRLVDWATPYSGSVCSVVRHLHPGYAAAEVPGSLWALYNPFGSVHALAQANAAEMCSGLAVLTAMQDRFPAGANTPRPRAIVTSLEAKYMQKARGTLVVIASCPADWLQHLHEVSTQPQLRLPIRDAVVECHVYSASAKTPDAQPVARVTVNWTFGWPSGASDKKTK